MNDYSSVPFGLSFDDALLIPNRSPIKSRQDVNLSWQIKTFKFSLPIISINMDDVTGTNMAIKMAKLGSFGILPRFDKPSIQAEKVHQIKKANCFSAAAIGIKPEEWERLSFLIKAKVDHISIDVAHGHLETTINLVKKIKNKYPHISLSSGVIATYQGAKDLFNAGADIVRVGVGPGTICTTRLQTGTGVPQITAIMEASRAARKFKKQIWADGGTKNSGDITKCLAAGASAVIVGSQLAGSKETPGEKIKIKNKYYKQYNASTSFTAKNLQIKKNSNDKSTSYIHHIEGIESIVPYRGPVKHVIKKLESGIRSGFSYSGAKNIPQLWKKANWIRVSTLGVEENKPHNVIPINTD